MAGTLSKRVQEYLKNSPSIGRGAARDFIIANRTEIQRTLNHGHSIKSLWEVLRQEGSVGCTYPRFCEAIKKHLPVRLDVPYTSEFGTMKNARIVMTAEKIPANAIQGTDTKGDEIRNFVWNRRLRKEDLI